MILSSKKPLLLVLPGNRLGHGDPVVKKAFTVGIAREYAWTRKSSNICVISWTSWLVVIQLSKKSCLFVLNIMFYRDLVVKEALTAGFLREQAWTRKYSTICVMSSTICDWSSNFLSIMVSSDLDVKHALTVGVARDQAWTRKSSTIPE